MTEGVLAELSRLQAENAHLKAILQQHGITWDIPLSPAPSVLEDGAAGAPATLSPVSLSPAEKIALFQSLFRGRTDVYPQRWESQKGTSGYSPVCGNEWRPGICGKPKVRCGDCEHRQLTPLTEQALYDHLAGKKTLGVYPLLPDDSCHFLAMDFDEAQWRDDALAALLSCQQCNVPASLEISRSGKGAHIWIFFSVPVSAREARMLGAALVSHTCERTRQLALSSYDRFFPSQDTLPKGGFGNLIALPLQKTPRSQGHSVFVDTNFTAFADQWAYLSTVVRMTPDALSQAILQASGGRHPLDVAFTTDGENTVKPWENQKVSCRKIAGPLPSSITLVLANQIFIDKREAPQPLLNRLIRLAAFANPEFYKAQAMRLPVWNKPRLVCCAENLPQHIGLPRGCLDALLELLEYNSILPVIEDKRVKGSRLSVKFKGKLRKDQQLAVKSMLAQDIGVLHATTAFGKTVAAAALIAKRKASTLVLVHRADLLRQWQERLVQFLGIAYGDIGVVGTGKHKPGGKIDIALLQTLARKDDLGEFLDGYGHIIVDECHHISAFSFENILKQAKAPFILGLTATPQRRDGHHPIIFMQCGDIRHSVVRTEHMPARLDVKVQSLPTPALPPEPGIHEVFRALCEDVGRNIHIVEDICKLWYEGRKTLVLTERTSHLEKLQEHLAAKDIPCHILHGHLSGKQRALVLEELKAMPDTAARVILATGRLIGEGFDHSPLNTMVLAMPVSWQGTLQQYAGRLHREHADKTDIRIYDYVEKDNPQLYRMWKKRCTGYGAMGYQISETDCSTDDIITILPSNRE
ncbi:MAG: DEAD/DEAH box helicase [Desulfovibrio sp.]|jgi:superfamily II DNA or RNA helicase|nr:DEAD/DEAH box helicase [Desulfovibrio sp.]